MGEPPEGVQETVEPLVNPVPAMATETGLVAPAVAEDGVRLEMVGADAAAVMTNAKGVEVRPAVVTVTWAVPAVDR